MTLKSISLLGGKSVHCINEQQMEEAVRMAENDEDSSPKIQHYLTDLEKSLTRNELASLAYVIIKRLKESG